ncbi:glycosyltransferase family 2 protein [Leisingera aquaemixtae]|uniref:glycosyltransferase family 2 protein n=1 Tax=Leisingera TaxID=191028 RepID=UPI001150A8C8|nr:MULTISPECIES: glycosyltransferase family 2 protein [Leisingera]QDI76985.1 glycosyltransferase family 2 protein [Leisingera aquaemixtae]UWQ25314.1 glycosyltransferase family 2 protein [Leisingera aquaemixtae]UWQ37842.1 glycosyltransferase family 2 protein [Leisingera aquaemixtae]
MQLSVVVPCYNEEESVPLLVERLVQAIEPWAQDAEIILADDGSSDGTWAAIEAAHARHPVVRGIRLSANRGHQVALTAGLESARGARIFMLDADLQDPPEILPDMMMMMDRGYDVVYGRRAERQGETLFKKATAFLFYRFLNTLSDVDIPKDTGDFRLVSRRALDAVLAMPERARFIRGMFAWAGFKQIGLEYVRDARVAGETKYPFRAMLRFATDALTGFSTKPLKMATRLAFLSLYVTFLMAVYVFLSLILYNTAPGWASMLLALSFFSGIQLLTLGIMGEYIGRLYMESKQRPMYFLSEETGEGAPAEPVKIEPAPLRKEAS